MKFDKSRVFTTVNADELKVGSKVIVADNLASLKRRVAVYYNDKDDEYVTTIESIEMEACEQRFKISDSNVIGTSYWQLAYLISEPGSINCEALKIGDIITNGETDLMILGIRRNANNVAVYLPDHGWCGSAFLKNFYKKEK